LLAGWKNRAAWGLAGGLNPGNVAEAVRMTGAPLVDTSSGVERAPGVKDTGLIADFCRAARG
jgi:phosphoribosylanthranilate isomerase